MALSFHSGISSGNPLTGPGNEGSGTLMSRIAKDDVFFSPGDTVTLRQKLENKPTMIVKTVDRVSDMHEKPRLLGITCQWFNTLHELQTARFSTKDLLRL